MKKILLSIISISLIGISFSQNWNQMGTTTFNNQANAFVVVNDTVYVGGDFWSGCCNYVSMWDGTSWSLVGSLPNKRPVEAMSMDAEKNLIVTADDGRDYFLSKWDGTSWNQIGTEKFNGYIYDIEIADNGDIYIAGAFENANNKQYVAKWDGLTWTSVGTFEADNDIYELEGVNTSNGFELYVAGRFSNESVFGAVVAHYNGSSWSYLDQNFPTDGNPKITSLETDGQGNVYSANSDGVAQWNGTSWVRLGDAFTQSSRNFDDITVSSSGVDIYGTHANGAIVDGAFRYSIVKWDGTTWEEVGNTTNGFSSKSISREIQLDEKGNVYTNDMPNSSSTVHMTKYTPKPLSVISTQAISDVVTIFPNPATESITLNITDYELIEFYNAVGQKVLTQNSGTPSIDISSLESGVYTLKIITDVISSTRLVVE